MTKYAHRHVLLPDDANLRFRGSERAQIIRAAFAVAERGHYGKSRDKLDADIGYISHPLMVYDILCRMGEGDPALLGAAFLHDVLEEPEYRDEPERLQRELEMELEKEGLGPLRATHLADDIYQLVYEVTNPEVLPKDKELYQIDRVAGMSFAAKKLKIADQAASLVCNLIMPNDPNVISYAKEENFKEKAATLVTQIIESVQDDPVEKKALQPYDAFFANSLAEANRLFSSFWEGRNVVIARRAQVRRDFDFDSLFTGSARTMLPVTERDDIHAMLDLEAADGAKVGLARVYYDVQGRIAHFAMHVSQERGADIEANRVQEAMTKAVREQMRRMSRYTQPERDTIEQGMLRPGELDGAGYRLYHMYPPLEHQPFAAAAYNAGACTRADGELINRTGSRLHRSHTQRSSESGRGGYAARG